MGSAPAPELWGRSKQFGDVDANSRMLISTALRPVVINKSWLGGQPPLVKSAELKAGSQGVRGSNPLSSTLACDAVPAMFAHLSGYVLRSIAILS
jgi:hypothetical protein